MKSINLFLEEQERSSKSPRENWRKRELDTARDALNKGRISQQQFNKHRENVRDMADQPGGLAQAGVHTYSDHETQKRQQKREKKQQTS